jgi:heme-degrading monooxygenase HmoA
MAVVLVNEIQGGDQSFYEQVTSRVMPNDQLPGGCRDHIAGPMDGGWRVITVWDSDEDFQRFRTEKLIPAMQEAGRGASITPNIQSSPVFRHITA